MVSARVHALGPTPLSHVDGVASIVDNSGAILVLLGGGGKGDSPWFRTNPGLYSTIGSVLGSPTRPGERSNFTVMLGRRQQGSEEETNFDGWSLEDTSDLVTMRLARPGRRHPPSRGVGGNQRVMSGNAA